jgi:DnaK suppressor protein
MPLDSNSGSEIKEYRPSDGEPFLNERQQEYFRKKSSVGRTIFLKRRRRLCFAYGRKAQITPISLTALPQTPSGLELRARGRQRKLMVKIDAALKRLDEGTYGYCEDTGEPIGLRRLEARPIATFSVEAQERHERDERLYSED